MLNRMLIKIGKLCLQSKALTFLACLPVLLSFSLVLIKTHNLEQLQEKMESLHLKAKSSFLKREFKNTFIKKYQNSDPYFLSKQLESLSFNLSEKKALNSFLSHTAFHQSFSLKNRLAFLKSSKNTLSFKEENISSNSFFKETEEIQQNPVELDINDIKKILSLVEEVSFENILPLDNTPFMIIKNFELTKKNSSSFVLENMFIIKRDFIRKNL